MHRFNFRFYVLFLFLTLSGFTLLRAQSTTNTYSKREMRKDPVWISMMNDPNANYFETIKAFREFWKDRVLPKEPFDEGIDVFEREVGLIDEGGDTEREREREQGMSVKAREESLKYAADVRAFKGWLQDTKPWVRADGSIVSIAERQALLDQQRNELKQIEQQQK